MKPILQVIMGVVVSRQLVMRPWPKVDGSVGEIEEGWGALS
jgi:hypothetical protein